MRDIYIAALMVLLFACKNEYHSDDRQPMAEDSGMIKWVGPTSDPLFDTVAVPVLAIDSMQLLRYLKFTDNVDANDGAPFGDIDLNIDEAGTLTFRGISCSPSIRKEMDQFIDQLIMGIKVSQPSYLLKEPSKKLPYVITGWLLIEKDSVLFEINGLGGQIYMREKMSRPLKL